MTWNRCLLFVKSDLARLKPTKCKFIKYFFFNASFKITFWYRIGCYLKTKNGLFFKLLYLLVFIVHKHNQYLTGIQLPIGCKIGKGLNFSHFSCIIINGMSIIGNNCTIFQGVTIGSVRGPKGGVPIIGNNVVICAGAKIIGNVKIGNNVIIGAGSVVVNNIPDNCVVVGVPARIISENGKKNVDYYLKNQ